MSHTFMGQVESLFGQLPKRLEWRSFLENDLPLLTKLDADVQAVAIMEKLNEDQMKVLGELRQHAPEKFHEVVTQKGVKPRQDLRDTRAEPDELRPLNDVNAWELRQLASHEAIRRARHQHPVSKTPAWPEGKFRCQLTWVKPTGMTPFSWQFNAEHVLFGRIGHLPILEKGHKILFEAPSSEHSTKPDVLYERVRAVSPGPRLELFARKPREGFQVWGHEVRMVSDESA